MTDTTVTRLDFSAPPPDAVRAAWAWHEENRDPPGVQVLCWPHEKASDPPTAFTFWQGGPPGKETPWFDDEDDAREAAWAWYKRRHALAARIDAEFSHPADAPGGVWPDILAWTDVQVAAVEHIDRTAPENP